MKAAKEGIGGSVVYGIALFALAAAAQLPALFGGFELADSGFYMTFYANIFDHPETVEYNFMYWLSGIIGGALLKIFPDTLLTMRIVGLLFNLGCVACVWSLMRDREYRLPLLAGSFAVALGTLFNPLTFYYDILTPFLALLSLTLLFHGLQSTGRKTIILILIAGLAAGVNTFSRIPNILEGLFVLLVPLYCRIFRRGNAWRLSLLFIAGWVMGIVLTLLTMQLMGHLDIFLSNLRELTGIAGTSGDEASHGMGNLILAQFSAYRRFGLLAIKLLTLCALWWFAGGFKISNFWKNIISVALFIPAAWMLWKSDIVTSLAAISFGGALCGIAIVKNRNLKFLSAMGLAMMVILPLGSDGAIYNGGTEALWLAVPVALAFLSSGFASTSYRKIARGSIYVIAIVIVISLSALSTARQKGLYFDNTPLAGINTSIEAKAATGIYTSRERGGAMTEILTALRGNVTPGDTLMVYGSAPMLNYLTGTLPAFGNSWPEQLSAAMLQSKLDRLGSCPDILMVKFNTLSADWGIPSDEYAKGEIAQNIYHNAEKSEKIYNFIGENGYRAVKETPYFTLYSKR